MAKNNNTKHGSSDILGMVGTNYKVKDTPCLIPQENIRQFRDMQKQAQKSSFGNWPNPFNAWWRPSK